MDDGARPQHCFEPYLTGVAFRDGVDSKQAEVSLRTQQEQDSEEEIGDEIGASTAAICDVGDQPISVCRTSYAGDAPAAQERGVSHDYVESSSQLSKHFRK